MAGRKLISSYRHLREERMSCRKGTRPKRKKILFLRKMHISGENPTELVLVLH